MINIIAIILVIRDIINILKVDIVFEWVKGNNIGATWV